MGVYVRAVVSTIAVVITIACKFSISILNSFCGRNFAFSSYFVVLDWLRNHYAMFHYHWYYCQHSLNCAIYFPLLGYTKYQNGYKQRTKSEDFRWRTHRPALGMFFKGR